MQRARMGVFANLLPRRDRTMLIGADRIGNGKRRSQLESQRTGPIRCRIQHRVVDTARWEPAQLDCYRASEKRKVVHKW